MKKWLSVLVSMRYEIGAHFLNVFISVWLKQGLHIYAQSANLIHEQVL